MKLALTLAAENNPSVPVVLSGSLEEAVNLAADLSYDGLELHYGSPEETPFEKITELTSGKNLSISALATGRIYTRDGLSLIDASGERRFRAISRLKTFIDAASPLGATVILGCVRGNISEFDDKGGCLSMLAESVKELAIYAAENKVSLVIEAINRYENNYLNNAAETVEFIEKHRIPNTKLLLDTFHMNIEEKDICGAILESGNMIGYVHFADNNRLYPGAGHIPFDKVVDSLKTVDYKGYISAECLPFPDMEEAAAAWIKRVKPLI